MFVFSDPIHRLPPPILSQVHLKSTYYNYGNYLESFDRNEARKYYKLAGTELPDCTRLLLTEQPRQQAEQMLVDYVSKSPDNEKLQRWYAQFLQTWGRLL